MLKMDLSKLWPKPFKHKPNLGSGLKPQPQTLNPKERAVQHHERTMLEGPFRSQISPDIWPNHLGVGFERSSFAFVVR
jgi:hypothetical protein